jgi:hypothetical protein
MEVLLLIASLVAFYFYRRHRSLKKALSEQRAMHSVAPNWLRSYALYFLTGELNDHPKDERGHITLLLNRQTDLSLEQAMATHLQIFLRHEYGRDRATDDYKSALHFTSDLLRKEFAYRSSPMGLRQFVRELLVKDGKDVSDAAVEDEFKTLMTFIRDTGDAMTPMMGVLKDSFNDMFTAQFGKSFAEYAEDVGQKERQILTQLGTG